MAFEGPGYAAPDVPAESGEHRPLEVQWLHSILSSIREGMLVLDPDGLVLQMNQAFTDLLGYGLDDAPVVPPYPWWPSEEEDAQERAAIWARLRAALAGEDGVAEFRYYDRHRRPVWIACADAAITNEAGEVVGVVRTFRDITGQKESQTRRAAAARISADLASAEDIETVLSVAQHGFEVLFDGGSTAQLDVDERHLFSGGRRITSDELTEGARIGLEGTTSADATNPRPGILLVPQTSTTGCRIWIQFAKPRRIDTEEMIAADLFAQAFGLAVDRNVIGQMLEDNRANLERAIESHRHIGQAVGILVERYRVAPSAAFDRLRQASQQRNLKLRELAARVVRTGEDPDIA